MVLDDMDSVGWCWMVLDDLGWCKGEVNHSTVNTNEMMNSSVQAHLILLIRSIADCWLELYYIR